MNPDVKAAWVAALRSGRIPKAYGSLRETGNERCCLGVLCDLAEEAQVGAWDFVADSTSMYFGTAAEFADNLKADSAVLPPSVIAWAGTPGDNPAIDVQGQDFLDDGVVMAGDKTNLAELNDGGLTFDQIADVIDYFL